MSNEKNKNEGQDVKIRDLQVGEDIMDIVEAEVVAIKLSKTRSAEQLMKLEKLSKVYGLLMSSLRENIKHNIFSKLQLDETDSGVAAADDSDDPSEDLEDGLS